ncbi:hypothetical protein DEO72_LG4g726 [Vigna unguiculata]|uniref:Uncharacterized protein n=1 Tax=Vigna unguiculata TaxID=3917 RepID=A0A4D6LMH3_VIGUN|nr:hypothetical protein DEO72_LG4g726 [Vigna unguiculata]
MVAGFFFFSGDAALGLLLFARRCATRNGEEDGGARCRDGGGAYSGEVLQVRGCVLAVAFCARRWRCAAREVAERSREEENGVAMMVALRRRFAQMQVRGGGAQSCDGGRKRRREWRKMVVFGLVAAVVRRRCGAGLLLFPASFSGGRRGDGGGGCHGDGRRGEN